MRIDESSAVFQFLENGTDPQTAKPGKWWARIKPKNRRTGHLAEVVNFTGLDRGKSLILREKQGWRILDGPSSRMLRTLMEHRNEGDLKPHAIDVATYEEAKRLEIEQRLAALKQREAKLSVDSASVLSTSDLPSNRDERDADRQTNIDRLKRAESDERQSREDRAERLAAEARAASRDQLERDRERLRRELEAEGLPVDNSATG